MNCYSRGFTLALAAFVLTLSGTGCGDTPGPGSDVHDAVETEVQTEDVVGDPGVAQDMQVDTSQDTNGADVAYDSVIDDVPQEEVSADITVDEIHSPDCDIYDVVATDVPDTTDAADADAELPPRDADDVETDILNPLACASSDDECIGKLELGPCQRPHCNTLAGLCEAVDKDDDDPCSDGDFCTGPDKCVSGDCVAGPAVDCSDDNECTTDECQPSTGCVNTKLNATGCNDGELCTVGDTCVDGDCVGTVHSCDDARDCTQDVCDGAGNCQHPLMADTCLIDAACAAIGDSDPDDPCRQCIPGVNQYDWSPVEAGTVVPGAPVWYLDFDEDGYGDPDATQQVCGQPEGYVAVAGDCNDGEGGINPGELDLCDNIDTDCDGTTDEDFPIGELCDGADDDQCKNGTFVCKADGTGVECNNEWPTNITETCNGRDDDCNGITDEGFAKGAACDGPDFDMCMNGTFVCRADGTGVECINESLTNITETCNGTDDDCDGTTDEDFSAVDWDDAVRAIGEACGTGACDGGQVVCSLDGLYAECDTSHLATIELLNGIDDDCNGLTDDDYCTPDCSGPCGFDPVCGVSCGSCPGSDFCVDGQCVWQAGEYTVNCGADGMCFVPEGPFWMGCNETVDSQCMDKEKPYHEVTLSAYYMDKTEVTQSEYKKCVDAGECSTPSSNWDPTVTPNRPVVGVNWIQAGSYCAWTGKRLPTEAEWEKAARGTDGRKYPWGNETATCEYAVMNDGGSGCGTGSRWDVCSKTPSGDSPYGLCDMSGNVYEWVSDWDDVDYYSSSPSTNPTGPFSGSYRVMRGGSFYISAGTLRASDRFGNAHSDSYGDFLGFRCVRSEVLPEACDGIDNDIDGLTDEDFSVVDWDDAVRAVGETCGTGACGGGQVVCSLDGSYAECDTSHLATIELLNGIDDDCNGLTDDDNCTPDCAGRECGLDPVCGTVCGTCTGSDVCAEGQCVWQAGEYTVNCGADGMCFVPEGPFWMGCNETVDTECTEDEKRYHEVILSAFYVDKTEVTQSDYQKCVDAGECAPSQCDWEPTVWDPVGMPDRPAVCVDWVQAGDYCAWAGKRLPTEAEWEKAARGTDGRKYPWGNETATCEYAVVYDGSGAGCGTYSTWDVCSKSPAGDSPYGLCDMPGNVNEWVSDWYFEGYYADSPASNPTGPVSGSYRVVRGGGFDGSAFSLRASDRSYYFSSGGWGDSFGFRCVRPQ